MKFLCFLKTNYLTSQGLLELFLKPLLTRLDPASERAFEMLLPLITLSKTFIASNPLLAGLFLKGSCSSRPHHVRQVSFRKFYIS